MKKIGLALVVFLTAACNNGGSAETKATNTTSNSNVSFGIYDIASSGPSATRIDVSQSPAVNAASQVPDTTGGGGGGGAQEVRSTQPAAQKISLYQTENTQNAPTDSDRKIIRNAELNLETESPETAQQQITAIAESKGGFVVESQQSSSDVKVTTRDIVTMTVRVPAARFSEALDEIRRSASRIIVESVKGQDVTEEFIDIEARLKAKKSLEAQFMEIMKRANSVEDALDVQRQLADVRGEIEQIEGRKRFLENQASLSTIKIRLQTPTAIAASSSGFGYRLSESFSTGFDFALNFVLGLVTFIVAILPFALIFMLPGYFIFRYLWKQQNRPKSVSQIAEEEIESI